MKDDNGVWQDKDDMIGIMAGSYFSNIFKSTYHRNMDSILSAINKNVTDQMNRSLIASFTAEEVKRALFHKGPFKEPGIDGFLVYFYQNYWNTVGNDVTQPTLNFLNNNGELKEINHY